MENLTSSIIIGTAITLGSSIIGWVSKTGVTTLLTTLKELRVAIHELCLDVKEWSTITKGLLARVDKVEKDVEEMQKGGYNGNYGSYPNKSSN